MKYLSIIEHLRSCGYMVSTTTLKEKLALSINLIIDKYQVNLIHIEVNELTSMPSFLIENPQNLPKLAHTLCFEEINLATLCVNVPDSVSINFEVPEKAFEDSLKRHIELITRCLTNPTWNKEELLREFLASWHSLNHTKFNEVLCLAESSEFCKLKVYAPEGKHALQNSTLVHPEDYDLEAKAPFFKFLVNRRTSKPDLGCILPLPDISYIPWTASDWLCCTKI